MLKNLIFSKYYPELSDYAKILIPSLITYLLTRYSLNRPRKYEIMEKQFTLVYLPLYLLMKQLLTGDYPSSNIQLFTKKATKIIYKNYQFVFPKTLKLFSQFKNESSDDAVNTYHISNFVYQLESDYEKLKRELGYPTNSLFDFFKRLNRLEKLLYVISFLCTIAGIYLLVGAVSLLFVAVSLDALVSLVVSFFFFFLAYLFSYSLRH